MKTNLQLSAYADDISDGSLGLCRACGQEAYQIEPDARKYTCESCGEPQVYGLEELLMMGELDLLD